MMSDNADCLDLVQTLRPGKKLQLAVKALKDSIESEMELKNSTATPPTIPKAMPTATAGSTVWQEFKDEFGNDDKVLLFTVYIHSANWSVQLFNILSTILPMPETPFALSNRIQLKDYSGELELRQLAGEDGCAGLIFVIITGPPYAIVREPNASEREQRSAKITLGTDRVYMISGRCSIIFPEQTKVFCAAFCVWRESI